MDGDDWVPTALERPPTTDTLSISELFAALPKPPPTAPPSISRDWRFLRRNDLRTKFAPVPRRKEADGHEGWVYSPRVAEQWAELRALEDRTRMYTNGGPAPSAEVGLGSGGVGGLQSSTVVLGLDYDDVQVPSHEEAATLQRYLGPSRGDSFGLVLVEEESVDGVGSFRGEDDGNSSSASVALRSRLASSSTGLGASTLSQSVAALSLSTMGGKSKSLSGRSGNISPTRRQGRVVLLDYAVGYLFDETNVWLLPFDPRDQMAAFGVAAPVTYNRLYGEGEPAAVRLMRVFDPRASQVSLALDTQSLLERSAEEGDLLSSAGSEAAFLSPTTPLINRRSVAHSYSNFACYVGEGRFGSVFPADPMEPPNLPTEGLEYYMALCKAFGVSDPIRARLNNVSALIAAVEDADNTELAEAEAALHSRRRADRALRKRRGLRPTAPPLDATGSRTTGASSSIEGNTAGGAAAAPELPALVPRPRQTRAATVRFVEERRRSSAASSTGTARRYSLQRAVRRMTQGKPHEASGGLETSLEQFP